MKYEQIKWLPEDQDPSMTIETSSLVAKVIDNTGLQLEKDEESKSPFTAYGLHKPLPFSRPLGNHGIRTLYHKDEKRNVVIPFGCWLNLQGVRLSGTDLDPIDERVHAGVGRGWPMRMERRGEGAALHIDKMPMCQLSYTIEFRPAEPDGIEFSVRFTFGAKSADGPARFRATWPCYMSAYDDVRFHYPMGPSSDNWQWTTLGEKPDIIVGETVGYEHQQSSFLATDQALPVGYGRIGEMALILMFDDPRVRFFVVNAGGHLYFSPVQNPAWDFEWEIENYPLNEPVGFNGKLIYAPFVSQEHVLERYRQWSQVSSSD